MSTDTGSVRQRKLIPMFCNIIPDIFVLITIITIATSCLYIVIIQFKNKLKTKKSPNKSGHIYLVPIVTLTALSLRLRRKTEAVLEVAKAHSCTS